MSNRIKKLYLIDEDEIRNAASMLSGGGNKRQQQFQQQNLNSQLPTESQISKERKKQFAEVLANPLTEPLEKEAWSLDSMIKNVYDLRHPTGPIKALHYLRAVKRYLDVLEEMKEKEREEMLAYRERVEQIPEERKDKRKRKKKLLMSEMLLDEQEQQQQQQPETTAVTEQPKVYFDPSTLLEFGEKKQMYNEENMIQDVHSRMKPRFKDVLQQLKTNAKSFSWDPSTGEVILYNERLPGSNIRELIMHKLKYDMKEMAGDKPPPSFYKFNQYLKRKSIKSGRQSARVGDKKGPAVPVHRGVVSRHDKRESVLKKRPKQQSQKQQQQAISGTGGGGGGAVKYLTF
jgi:hypothetical protein